MAGIAAALFGIGEVRRPAGPLRHVFRAYAAAVTLVVVYVHFFTYVQPWTLAALFLSGIYVLIFPLVCAGRHSNPARPSALDFVLCAISLAIFVYFGVSANRIVNRVPVVDELTTIDMIVGVVYVILSIEVTRRTTGLGLALIVLFFLAYIFLGHHLGGVIGSGRVTLEAFLDSIVYGIYGLHGEITRVAASYALLFVMFGALLTESGGGQFFYNMAAALTGRSAGGPAKIAVISSGLYGTISGNAVSDVVTTGSVTIPMMKRVGYAPQYAAAVEATASLGGSLTPPVMGAAAFVMAEYTGISYADIAFAALGPSMLFYFAVFSQVHFRAKRDGMAALQDGEVPRFGASMREGGLFLVPLVVLIAALALGYTAPFAAIVGTIAVVIVAALRARTRL
ncbi:MAG: TRAP transporter permease, partial [Alphaproteobacteria bacterium]